VTKKPVLAFKPLRPALFEENIGAMNKSQEKVAEIWTSV
jgi:hypothetical protein